jgi:hypothetical protein
MAKRVGQTSWAVAPHALQSQHWSSPFAGSAAARLDDARRAESVGPEHTMSGFIPRAIELAGEFTVAGPVSEVFELFSPLGERKWVPEWNPELLHPPGAAWERGLVFRTQEERGEAVWIVTDLDQGKHEVEYRRVESARYVARVRVRCRERANTQTEVATEYAFIGLSEEGNAEIALMTHQSYAEKMQRWQGWITACLAEHDRRGGKRHTRNGRRRTKDGRRRT